MLKSKIISFSVLILGLLFTGCQQREPIQYEWNQETGYRWSDLPETGGQPGFENIASETGITFSNNLPQEDIFENRHYLNGSGVATGDVDDDGWTDIYFAQLNGPNKLYKNQGGFRFVDITDSAGVAHEGFYSTSVTFADIDGDSDLDLLVTSMGQENVIYINDGSGSFSRQSENGLSESRGSHTMALADIDSDGDLDLYITNYKKDNVLDLFDVKDLAWERTVKEPYDQNADKKYTLLSPYDNHYKILYYEDGRTPERREKGRTDELYINDGNGNFEKVENIAQRFLDAEGNPKGLQEDWGLTARFHDINQDGLPDLYVCNDFWTKDRIWINQGEGVFKEMDPLAIRNMSFSAMGVDFSDVNRDGSWDIFVTEMLSQNHEGRLRQFIPDDPHPKYIGQYDNQPQYNRNSFYLNRGDNTFAEISYFSGLEASEWSWATRFLDVDLDGYEDLLITTGYTYDVQDLDAQEEWRNEIVRGSMRGGSQIDIYPPLNVPNKVFRNNGDARFEELSSEWGFTEDDVSHGLASADFDHDGDLDLVANRLNQPAAIYENKASAPRIAIKLIGESPNTQAIGAKIELRGGPVNQMDEISAGGDYLSHSDPYVVFAADPDNPNHQLTITWPDGEQSIIDSVQANRIYEINEQSIPKKYVDNTSDSSEPIFEDVSEKISHSHHEAPYDDFRIQPLLPQKLTKLGPGVSWIDYNSDGDEDLFITSGRDGSLAAYENDGDGNFESISLGKLTQQTPSDQTAILGLRTDQQTTLLVGNANFEPGDVKVPSVLNYAFENGEVTNQNNIPGIYSTTGPIAAADYEGDGDLDLFVGGRFVPAQYPVDATSRLFVNEDGRFVQDQINSGKFDELGLVTGAVFSDYDQDGDQDLLLSLEWDSIKLFENQNGEFYDRTSSVGLDQYKGWWNDIATGDFNNDGRPDIIATNRGLNSPYQLDTEQPLKMYYQDFNRDGRVDIIESYYNPLKDSYVPRRQLDEYESISGSFTSGVSSYEAFANASLNEVLRTDPNRIPSKEINNLSHMVFINEGDSFNAHPLPDEAQFSAAFYAGVADYNNDGNEDLFLSQNFFQVRENRPRLDGGRGLWLKGDGTGNFEAIPGQQSGVKVYGEQRGATISDFNSDGKVDLAVSQNGAETKLFQNNTPNPGLTVRPEGPPQNRDAIGSSIRLIYEDGTKGPRREIQAGSGYWSQNSPTQILGVPPEKKPAQIEISWFDETVDRVDYVSGQLEYRIKME